MVVISLMAYVIELCLCAPYMLTMYVNGIGMI